MIYQVSLIYGNLIVWYASKKEIVDKFESVHPSDFSKEEEPPLALAALHRSINGPKPNFIQVNHVSLDLTQVYPHYKDKPASWPS